MFKCTVKCKLCFATSGLDRWENKAKIHKPFTSAAVLCLNILDFVHIFSKSGKNPNASGIIFTVAGLLMQSQAPTK